MSHVDVSRARAIKGWMSEEELCWLATQALYARTIVEVGSFRGRSARALADHTDGVVWCIDPWDGIYLRDDGAVHTKINTAVYPEFCANLRDHIDSGRVVPVKAKSLDLDTLELLLADLGDGADLVFLDGDHRRHIVTNEIVTYRSLVKPGGILAGHDYTHSDWPGVKEAVDAIFPQVNLCGSIWWVRL
jgi:predicted O-methyltransferase YrrM